MKGLKELFKKKKKKDDNSAKPRAAIPLSVPKARDRRVSFCDTKSDAEDSVPVLTTGRDRRVSFCEAKSDGRDGSETISETTASTAHRYVFLFVITPFLVERRPNVFLRLLSC